MISIALAENTIGRQPQNGGNGDGFTVGGPMYTLNATGVHGVAQPIGIFQDSEYGVAKYDSAGTLRAGRIPEHQMVMAPTLTASNDPSRSPQSTEVTNQVAAVHAASMAVRRLTPVECERLQGFPDGYTNIPWRKQLESPDGPRYKALGNSMAVPVMAWIGRRIANVA
jgi:DNA (cytosine-5)-methyltransferase 1